MGHPFFDVPVPSVIGHRGCAGEAPENTLPAFERGLAQGAVILETDIHSSARIIYSLQRSNRRLRLLAVGAIALAIATTTMTVLGF